MDTKKCTGCKRTQPIDQHDLKYKTGKARHSKCIACRREYQRLYMKSRKGHAYLHQYGITEADYRSMLTDQNHRCAVCNKTEQVKQRGVTRRLAVDHCHKTQKVRGLLCMHCNMLLGMVKDRSDTLMSAVMYLRESDTCRSKTP